MIYSHVKEMSLLKVLDDTQLQELIDGLEANQINHYSHIINGYIGSRSFLTRLASVVSHLKTVNPDLVIILVKYFHIFH